MPKTERPLESISEYLPEGSWRYVLPYFKKHIIHLTLIDSRKTLLGDYRHPTRMEPYHRISINTDLNPYSFLVTLLHEIAHLETFEQYGLHHRPHGQEWKVIFAKILVPVLRSGILPYDVTEALSNYTYQPKASSCTDPHLFKTLYRYDKKRRGYKLVDELPLHQHFSTSDGRQFEKVQQLRTRCKCREIPSGKLYLFQGIMEVKVVQ